MRPVSLCTPWKPAITATSWRSLKRLIELGAVDVEDARRAMRVRGADRQLPALPGAGIDAHGLQRDRQQPGGDLLARGYHRIVFAGVVQRRRLAAPGHELVGDAGHGGDDDRHLMAGVDLALDVARDVADAVDVGDRGSAELHDESGHGWLDLRRDLAARAPHYRKPPREKARIHTGGDGWPQPHRLERAQWRAARSPGTISTVDEARGRALLGALAAEWWDPRGKMGMLHKFNPVRLGFIKQAACGHFERDGKRLDALSGLRILDIGCGGGILSEPLARLGAAVVGADPSQANIEAAQLHAAAAGVTVDYRATTAEALADDGERFRHRARHGGGRARRRSGLFIKRCAEMVKPGGLMIAATINRTLKSFALAIVGAEYVLRWLPRGTHRWDKFVTPNELEAALERQGLRVIDETGVIYNPLADRWQISTDMDVNYMVVAERAPS